MEFTPEAFVANLPYMLVGMLSIFIVIGIIMAVTVVLNLVTSKFGKDQ